VGSNSGFSRLSKALGAGVAAGALTWLVLTAATMVSGPRGFDPYPEEWRSTSTNLIRVGLHYVGAAVLVSFAVTVTVETILWRRSRGQGLPPQRASAIRTGTWVACGVAATVIIGGLLLVGTTPCAAYGSGIGSGSVECFEGAGLGARFLYAAYATGWVYGPAGLVIGSIVGAVAGRAAR
jgi:hypothetical protein